ncbi:MAG: T9SS C-terminal target domain-containing protein, partial [Calditrichaeota bacterium]
QNYPNPFNPETTLIFDLEAAARVKLTVYDVLGRKIVKLLDKKLPAGRHRVVFDGRTLPAGTYIYTLTSGKTTLSKRMILLK